ncbi:carbohydrate ABC transporter permease [Pedococcus sp. 5OH_020]|uniref:carbohydrate ABC transporter permease n=1 Tax=Pedococcus sp. 5OH_020 TaxID=2989814 RepID=UPI0022E9EFED|nr:sugar ABC transporter permease [Pedococcus sp. 5OH_020]
MVYVYVMVAPSAQGIVRSLTDWSFATPKPSFIGLENYRKGFQGEAGPATYRTIYIAFVVVVAQNVLGLGLALLLHGPVVGRHILRTIIFAPMVVSSLVVGYLFKYIFGPPEVGAVNVILAKLGLAQVDFLGNPTSALWIIIITVIWQFTGSTMVIYLAGLQGVPQELDEAAALDGAGYWKRFWYVTRPLLAPAITINLTIGLIGGLKLFDQIFALTNGGPGNQTQTISTLIYQIFSQFSQYGLAAALAVVLAIFVGILAFIQFAVLRRQERNS